MAFAINSPADDHIDQDFHMPMFPNLGSFELLEQDRKVYNFLMYGGEPEQIGQQNQQKEEEKMKKLYEKCAMELKEAKQLRELEKRAFQAELEKQKLITQNIVLQAKLDNMKQEKPQHTNVGHFSEHQSDWRTEFCAKIGELERKQTANYEQMKAMHDVLIAKSDEDSDLVNTIRTDLAEQLTKLDTFVGIVKDQIGKDLSAVVPPNFRLNFAEKFSNPPQNSWDATACHSAIEIIGAECATVHYKGNGNGSCSVFAKLANPSCASGIFYFEVKVLRMKSFLRIGFATKAMPLDRKVGDFADSYGYVRMGNFYINGACWINRNFQFSCGDTVGCGINLATHRLIFTKNGHPLDTTNLFVSPSSTGPLFPCVSLISSDDLIKANFGPNFKFDPTNLRALSKTLQQNSWDSKACHNDLDINGAECLMVHYKEQGHEWRSVFAKCFILNTSAVCSDTFYFEMKITNVKNRAVIGFTVKEQAPLDGSIKNRPGTFAYEGDGDFWINGFRKIGSSKFYNGDIVGCGLNLTTRRIFFTRNGHQMDTVTVYCVSSSLSLDHLFPFVSLWDSGDKIEANFGPHFKYDVANCG